MAPWTLPCFILRFSGCRGTQTSIFRQPQPLLVSQESTVDSTYLCFQNCFRVLPHLLFPTTLSDGQELNLCLWSWNSQGHLRGRPTDWATATRAVLQLTFYRRHLTEQTRWCLVGWHSVDEQTAERYRSRNSRFRSTRRPTRTVSGECRWRRRRRWRRCRRWKRRSAETGSTFVGGFSTFCRWRRWRHRRRRRRPWRVRDLQPEVAPVLHRFRRMTATEKKNRLDKFKQCSSCSTAVEHTPRDREVVDSNPAGCWAFFSSLSSQ